MPEFRLETERLVLRDYRESDCAPFAAMNADPEVMEFYPSVLDRAESDALLDKIAARIAQDGIGMWALERKTDGAMIGFTGLQLVPIECPIQGKVEIGWRLARECWGQGYAREAAEACVYWFMRNRDEPVLYAMCASANERSWGLMLRLGMQREHALDFEHDKIGPGGGPGAAIVYQLERPR